MGIFYNPPQPPTASNAGTPPEPHAPIGTQGSQPPRFSTAVMLVAVLAAWPADLEPRLARPNDLQKTTIAPLTLTYGQPPPNLGTTPAAETALIVAAWPSGLEPALQYPNDRRQVAPQNPPIVYVPVGTAQIAENTILAAWPDALEPRLSKPNERQQTVLTLTLPTGAPPPVIGTNAAQRAALARLAWPEDLEPRTTLPNNQRVAITPLTLAYGSLPTPTASLTAANAQIITGWPRETWPAQRAPLSVAWIAPPNTAGVVPFPYVPIASWPAEFEPRLSRPNERQQSIAPLTLATGSQPVPTPALSVPETQAIGAWPQESWPAQRSSLSTAWTRLSADQPSVSFPSSILAAWPDTGEPRLSLRNSRQTQIAPLTLASGDQPPVTVSAPVYHAILAGWPTDLEPRLRRPNDRQQAIVPLTLTYGQPPPILTIERRAAIVAAAWPGDLEPRLGKPNERQIQLAPLTLAYGQQPAVFTIERRMATVLAAWVDQQVPLRVTGWTAWIPASGVASQQHLRGSYVPLITRSGSAIDTLTLRGDVS